MNVGFLDSKALSVKHNLENDDINKHIDHMKPLKNDATDRKTINTDNYQFCFNKPSTSGGIRIQNLVLTKETVKANCLKLVSSVCGIMGTCFIIHNYLSPDTAVKTAALIAGGASNVLNRTNTLFRHRYGEVEDQDKGVGDLPDSEDQGTRFADELERKDKLDQE